MYHLSSKLGGRDAFTQADLSALSNALANARDTKLRFGELPLFGTTQFRFFIQSGSFVVPAGITAVRVRVFGGGGGGGAPGGSTTTGGTSSFGTMISATGGAGGNQAVSPGIGVGGDYQASGGQRGIGLADGAGGGGGGSGSQVQDGSPGVDGSGAYGGSGGNCATEFVVDRRYMDVASGAYVDEARALYQQVSLNVSPRFPFEFFSNQAFWNGGNANLRPWSGLGARGYSTSLHPASFGGGGVGGPCHESYENATGGAIGGGGGGAGQKTSDNTDGGDGGDGGGYAHGIFEVTPGDVIPFVCGARGNAATGPGGLAGSGGAGAVIVEF